MSTYIVSLLKAYFGDAATAENDFCFGHLPKVNGDHGSYRTVADMIEGKVSGYFLVGENPAVGHSNGKMQRLGLANLDWLVVRDLQMIESATFWKNGQEIATGELVTEQIATEVFFLPAASHVEKAGTFTQTQRLLQWRHKAIEPPADCRSDLWFYFHLGRMIKERLADSTDPRDRPLQDLAWNYPTEGPTADPDPEAVLREINGWGPDGKALRSYTELKDDGSTTAGCWIYTGVYADEVNQAARRKPGREQTSVAPEWGWAWPANRRILYNRASADPDGKPWSERKKYVWWDEEAGKWTGADVPDFEPKKRPDYVPPEGATAQDAIAGTDPFIMQSDGKAWLYAPAGLADGPMPTHYEPAESPAHNLLYGVQSNPAREQLEAAYNRTNPSYSEVYPYAFTTYRLTEHHTAGGMSRTLPYLAELQPEFFVEVSPQLAERAGARERRLGDGRDGARCRGGAGAGDRADAAAEDRRPGDPPDRRPVPLGRRGHLDRRLGQRPHRRRDGSQRAHPGVEGGHLRHPAGTPSARAGAGRLRRGLPQRAGVKSGLVPVGGRAPVETMAGDEAPVHDADREEPDVTSSELAGPAFTGNDPENRLYGPLPDVAGEAGYDGGIPSGWASSPTPRSASAARRARWRARSGTRSRWTTRTASVTPSACRGCRTTTPACWAPTPGGTWRSSSSRGPSSTCRCPPSGSPATRGTTPALAGRPRDAGDARGWRTRAC